jgi:hypothetical protein
MVWVPCETLTAIDFSMGSYRSLPQ